MSAPQNPASHPFEPAPGGPQEPLEPAGAIGLIPAAGRARRLGPLPCSKELLPIAITGAGPDGAAGEDEGLADRPRVRVVAERLMAALARGGVGRALVVVDRDKMDVPRHFATRPGRPDQASRASALPVPPALAFVPVDRSPSVPHSLAAALPFVGEAPVALGFPDVLFTPDDAFARLERHRGASNAALVLGLFPAPDPTTTDMVEVAPDGTVLRIEVRPRRSRLALNWLIAVWDRRFTAWLARRMAPARGSEATTDARPTEGAAELQLGALFLEALADGLPVAGVPFPDGAYLDIGTPAGYARALTATDPFGRDPSP